MDKKVEDLVVNYYNKKVELVLKEQCSIIANDSSGEYHKQVQMLIENGILRIANPTTWCSETPVKGGRDIHMLYHIRKPFGLVPRQRSRYRRTLLTLPEYTGAFVSLYNTLIENRVGEVHIRDFSTWLIAITEMFFTKYWRPVKLEDLYKDTNTKFMYQQYLMSFMASLIRPKDDYEPNIVLHINDMCTTRNYQFIYNNHEKQNPVNNKSEFLKMPDELCVYVVNAFWNCFLQHIRTSNNYNYPKVVVDYPHTKFRNYQVLRFAKKHKVPLSMELIDAIRTPDPEKGHNIVVKELKDQYDAGKLTKSQYSHRRDWMNNALKKAVAKRSQGDYLAHIPIQDELYKVYQRWHRSSKASLEATRFDVNPFAIPDKLETPFAEVIIDWKNAFELYKPANVAEMDNLIAMLVSCANSINLSRVNHIPPLNRPIDSIYTKITIEGLTFKEVRTRQKRFDEIINELSNHQDTPVIGLLVEKCVLSFLEKEKTAYELYEMAKPRKPRKAKRVRKKLRKGRRRKA